MKKKNVKNVLCAIDVNDYDQQVVDLAATFAKQFGVDLKILHVTLIPDPTNAAWPAYLGSPDVLKCDNDRLKGVSSTVAGVNTSHHHLSGFPVEKILGFVDRNPAQLLVMGTNARKGLNRIFGSTARKIMRKVNCPTLILRQKQNHQECISESSLHGLPEANK